MLRKMDAPLNLRDNRSDETVRRQAHRKEGAMGDVQKKINEWITRNRQNMIRCPHQPGNLLITKQSCQRRRIKARQEDLANVMKGDVMDFIYRQGLSICLNCDAVERKAA